MCLYVSLAMPNPVMIHTNYTDNDGLQTQYSYLDIIQDNTIQTRPGNNGISTNRSALVLRSENKMETEEKKPITTWKSISEATTTTTTKITTTSSTVSLTTFETLSTTLTSSTASMIPSTLPTTTHKTDSTVNTTKISTTTTTAEATATVTTTTTTSSKTTTTTKSEITTTSELSTTLSTTTTDTTAAPESHPIPGWALGLICLVVAVVVFLAIWVLFVRYRRRKIPLARPVSSIFRKNTSKQQPDSSIIVRNFEQAYREKTFKGEIAKEFDQIQELSARINATKTRNIGQSEVNQNRNRFVDIIPFDDNYVMLKSEQGLPPSTYINASYVDDMAVLDKVIVTQGPKQNTVLDFWRMVVEKKCKHIIMLTNCLEQGRVKCFQYWPPNGQMLHFDDISLFTAEETEIHTGLLMRKIEVSLEDGQDEGHVHVVRQLHLTNWPDHGVPDHANNLLAFLRVASNFRDTEY